MLWLWLFSSENILLNVIEIDFSSSNWQKSMYNFGAVIQEQASVTLNCVIIKYCDGVIFVTYFFCFLLSFLTSVFWEKAQTRFWFRAILC